MLLVASSRVEPLRGVVCGDRACPVSVCMCVYLCDPKKKYTPYLQPQPQWGL